MEFLWTNKYNSSKVDRNRRDVTRNKALYFPYINLPDNDWLYLMLLYWDQLSSIVPSEYLYDRRKLSPHMSTLMKEGLVNFIEPQKFIVDRDEFGKAFLEFINRRVRSRNIGFRGYKDQRFLVHVEKLGPVADELVQMNLATNTEYPWYEMDSWVANAFMAYLASIIGSLPEVESAPITNEGTCFELLASYPRRPFKERIKNRQLILEQLFPFPKDNLSLSKIIKFKEKYEAELSRFRNKIEGICIDLSNIPDGDREEVRQIKMRELKDEIELIARRMQETWNQIIFLDIFPVLGASGSIVSGFLNNQPLTIGIGSLSLSTAIYRYIDRKQSRKSLLNQPLAYGALLNREWPRLRDGGRR